VAAGAVNAQSYTLKNKTACALCMGSFFDDPFRAAIFLLLT
jgi:hypothetical protein